MQNILYKKYIINQLPINLFTKRYHVIIYYLQDQTRNSKETLKVYIEIIYCDVRAILACGLVLYGLYRGCRCATNTATAPRIDQRVGPRCSSGAISEYLNQLSNKPL